MIGKIAGAVIGGQLAKKNNEDPTHKDVNPIAGALIGAATVAVARRFLPARVAMLGATVAGSYLTKKWAEKEHARRLARESATATGAARPATDTSTRAGIASIPTPVAPAPTVAKDTTIVGTATRNDPANERLIVN